MKKLYLILLFMHCFTSHANAYSVNHDFTVLLGPFNASKTSFMYNIDKNNYSVSSIVNTNGIFGSLYPFTASYITTGTINNNILTTTNYKSNSKSRFNTRSKEMFYDKEGKPTYRISTKNSLSGKKIEILPPPDNIHTTDLQTVIAEIAIQYSKVKFCNSTMHVFDGKKSFDVIFEDEGHEFINNEEYSSYKGEAVKCSMHVDSLGSNSDELIFKINKNNPIYFWILEDKKTKLPFIAKIENNSTPLGKLVVYTNNIQIKD